MNHIEDAERFVGHLYTRFLYRDLVYVGGGILVLAVPIQAHGFTSSLITGPWWFIVLVFLASYASGFAAQEAGVAVRAFRMYPTSRSFVDAEVDYLIRRGMIARVWGDAFSLHLERVIALKHMSAVFGSAGVLAFVFVQLYYLTGRLLITRFEYVLGSLGLAAFAAIMRMRNLRAVETQDRVVALWVQQIDKLV